MRSLVLGSVAGVAESLVTLAKCADVRSLASVRAQVDLQVFQSRERLVAVTELWLKSGEYSCGQTGCVMVVVGRLTLHLFGFSPECTLMWISSL